MARTGRPPKPTKLKVAAGNPGKRPLNDAEPRPAAGTPRCPDWLSRRAKAEWQSIVPELSRLGLLTVVDGAALAGYCQAVAELEEATRILDEEGRVCRMPILDKQGEVLCGADGYPVGERLKAHPAVAMQRSAAALVRSFLTEFGLSPSSRSRVRSAAPDGGGADGRESKFFGTAG